MYTQFHKNIAYIKNNGTPWMMPMLPESLKCLIPHNTTLKAFNKNKIIIKESEYPDQLVYVKNGSVSISYINQYVEKSPLFTGISIQGGLTASMGNLSDYVEYKRVQVFTKDTVVALIPFESIENKINKDRSLCMEYVKYASLCDKSRMNTLKINAGYPPQLRYKIYLAAKMIVTDMEIPEPDSDAWLSVPYPSGRHRHHIVLNVSKSTIDRMFVEWRTKNYYKYINNVFHIHASVLAELNDFSLQFS